LHAAGSVGQVGVTVSVGQKMLSTKVVDEVSTVTVQGMRGEAGPVQDGYREVGQLGVFRVRVAV
jgi:hypothetical protein